MKRTHILLSALSSGALLATAVPIGFAQEDTCTMRGRDRAVCMQQRAHVRAQARSSNGVTMRAHVRTEARSSTGATMRRTFAIPHVLERSGAAACVGLMGRERALCARTQSRIAVDGDVSAQRDQASCRAAFRAFMTQRNSDHREWHREHRGSETFAADHAAWHKESNEERRALIMELKAECRADNDRTVTGSGTAVNSDS